MEIASLLLHKRSAGSKSGSKWDKLIINYLNQYKSSTKSEGKIGKDITKSEGKIYFSKSSPGLVEEDWFTDLFNATYLTNYITHLVTVSQ